MDCGRGGVVVVALDGWLRQWVAWTVGWFTGIGNSVGSKDARELDSK